MVVIATEECKNYENGILESEKRAATVALKEFEKSYSSVYQGVQKIVIVVIATKCKNYNSNIPERE